MTQGDLLSWRPDFDGSTYERDRDQGRLFAQLHRIKGLMSDGQWWTLPYLEECSLFPQASISARIRDLRKSKWGGHTVERRHVSKGLWEYKLVAK
jgi:hypothetical protein